MSLSREQALEKALEIATAAAKIVLRIYGEDFEVDYKGKNDPVTRADREANAYITSALAAEFGGLPIVAEESDPSTFAGFERSPRAWFVDPLDGTREFVAKNGEFVVMIGLAEEGRATMGVVAWPASGRVFAGGEGLGAFEVVGGERRPIRVSTQAEMARARVLLSRSRATPIADAAVAKMGPAGVDRIGSAGIKAALVASGEADIYLHARNAGKRWDTCAPEAIVRAAGGEVTDAAGAPIDYRSTDLANRSGVLMTNGLLHAAALRALA